MFDESLQNNKGICLFLFNPLYFSNITLWALRALKATCVANSSNLLDMFIVVCLELAILINTSLNNPSQKYVVLESSSLAAQVWFGKRFKNHWLRVNPTAQDLLFSQVFESTIKPSPGSQSLVWQKVLYKNHWLPTRVVSTRCNQVDEL